VFRIFIALSLPLWHFTDVFGRQFIISTLAKRTGKCDFATLDGNRS